MPMPVTEPWGKLSPRDVPPDQAQRLSLVAHCIDVAAVALALLHLPTWRRRLSAAAGRPLSDADLARLAALAFLHDIGKAGAGFYSKGVSPERAQRWRAAARIGASRVALGHVQVVAPIFSADDAVTDALADALGLEEIMGWDGPAGGDEIQALWLAAISHHGLPIRLADLEGVRANALPSWTQPLDDYQPRAGLQRLGDAVRHILPEAFATDAPPLRARPALVHAFAGLVSLADWIASNTDEGFFPYDLTEAQDETRWAVAKAQAQQVLKTMRIDVEAARQDLRQRQPGFAQVFDAAHPRPVQAAMARPDLGPLLVLEAETGSGKTEAALWRFKTLFEAGEVDALCLLLPTRVAATAMAQRVQRFIDQLFPDASLRPNAVLAVPGYLRANGHEGARALTGFEVLWADDQDPARRPLYWAAEHSKRYFAAACATGTIDQFLLSTLQSKHAHLRGTALLRSLVVVDEVHASDAYMTRLLQAALARHVQAGGHGLLMSATLTGEARARLLSAGQPPRRFDDPDSGAHHPLAAPDAPYPCVADLRGLHEPDQGTGASLAPPKRIRRRVLPLMRDADAVAELVAQGVAQGARVLVIRNTVGLALATQRAIEARLGADHPALFRPKVMDGQAGDTVAMHHGRYAFEDRRHLDQAVEAAFGKSAMADTRPRVLVGTQTLEISLDCDADWMITDLVPIDVLLQRLGRLHRHAGRHPHRPAAFCTAEVVLLTPPEPDLSFLLAPHGGRGLGLGTQSAYDNVPALAAALELALDIHVRPEWLIPAHNRALVEAGASPAALEALTQRLGGHWPKALNEVLGKAGAESGQATNVLARWDQAWEKAAWSDMGEAVRTRLGQPAIELDLLQPWTSPLQQTLTRLAVPYWLLPKAPGDEAPVVEGQVEEAGDAGNALRLRVAGTELRYDRLGLRPA